MKNIVALLIILSALVTACSNPPKGDGVSVGNGNSGGGEGGNSGGPPGTPKGSESYLTMTADLTDATAITANIVTKAKDETKHLLKVSAEGKVKIVLSGEHELISFKLTPNFIVAHVAIADASGSCSLIAIPRINGVTRVRCLNRDRIHCLDNATTNGGYDTIGDEVYFAYQRRAAGLPQNINHCSEASIHEWDAAVSELRKWDGKSESVQTLFHSDPASITDVQPVVRDVFTSTASNNLCIHAKNAGLLCLDGKTEKWSKPFPNRFPMTFTHEVLKQNDYLLGESSGIGFVGQAKLNLSTFEISPRRGELPERVDFINKDGLIIGMDTTRTYCVEPNGDSKEILSGLVSRARPARLGNYGWYFGTGTLRRVELETCNVDAQDYLADSKLLSLTALSWSLGDFLRVDGIGEKGLPGSSLLNVDGKLVTNETVSIPIEHPIELTWK